MCHRPSITRNISSASLYLFERVFAWKSKKSVTSCELRVQIYELRTHIYELPVQIDELRVQIYLSQIQIQELRVNIYELRVQIQELGD